MREVVEELRVAGRCALFAKVINRADEATAEEVMPDAVHHHASDERVLSLREPARELEAPATSRFDRVRAWEGDWQSSGRDLSRGGVVAADEDAFVDAAPVEHRRRGSRVGLD